MLVRGGHLGKFSAAAISAIAMALISISWQATPSAQALWDDTDVTTPPAQVQVLPPRCLEAGETLPTKPGVCKVVSFGKSRPTVVVWGDSHAWQQLPALKLEAERTRTNLVAFVMGVCPPVDLRATSYNGPCARMASYALAFVRDKLDKSRSVKVVLGGFWRFYRDLNERVAGGYSPADDRERFMIGRATMFAEGGLKAFRTLGRWKVHTAAIGQMPWVPEEAPRCTTGENPYGCELARDLAIDDEAGTEKWLKSRLRGIPTSGYVDTTPYLCDAELCHPQLEGLPVYLDELHLDPAITEAFAPAYAGIFGR